MSAPLKTRKLTPDEVLAEFRLFCREYALVPKHDVDRRISHDTTVRELNELTSWDDLIHWTAVVVSLDVEVPNEWGMQWAPDDLLSDICLDLCERALVPVIEPITLLGRKCNTAAAFLTLKRMLADGGADVSELAPSSGIGSYVRQHPRPFQRFRLAFPGSSPIVQRLNTLQALGCLLVVGTALFWLTGCLCGWKDQAVLVTFPVMMVGGLLMILGRVYHRRFGHTFIEGLGRRPTFRDYIYALHGRHRRAGTA